MSPGHHIYVEGSKDAAFAYNVVVGDRLFTADGILARVVSTQYLTQHGIYAPLTLSGSLIVNGVLCSNYAEFAPSDTPLTHAAMSPMRALYRLLPLSIFESVAAVSNGFHWYPGTLVKLWTHVLNEADLATFVPQSLFSMLSA